MTNTFENTPNEGFLETFREHPWMAILEKFWVWPIIHCYEFSQTLPDQTDGVDTFDLWSCWKNWRWTTFALSREHVDMNACNRSLRAIDECLNYLYNCLARQNFSIPYIQNSMKNPKKFLSSHLFETKLEDLSMLPSYFLLALLLLSEI